MEGAWPNRLWSFGSFGAARESSATAGQTEYAAASAATHSFPRCDRIALIACVARCRRGPTEGQQGRLGSGVPIGLERVIVLRVDVQAPGEARVRSGPRPLALRARRLVLS